MTALVILAIIAIVTVVFATVYHREEKAALNLILQGEMEIFHTRLKYDDVPWFLEKILSEDPGFGFGHQTVPYYYNMISKVVSAMLALGKEYKPVLFFGTIQGDPDPDLSIWFSFLGDGMFFKRWVVYAEDGELKVTNYLTFYRRTKAKIERTCGYRPIETFASYMAKKHA